MSRQNPYIPADAMGPYNGQGCIPQRGWSPGIDGHREAAYAVPGQRIIGGAWGGPFDRIFAPADLASIVAAGSQSVTLQFPQIGEVVAMRGSVVGVNDADQMVSGLSSLQLRIQAGGGYQELIASSTGTGYASFADLFSLEVQPSPMIRRVEVNELWTLTIRNVHASAVFVPSLAFYFRSAQFQSLDDPPGDPTRPPTFYQR